MDVAGRVIETAARRGLPDLVVAAFVVGEAGSRIRLGSDITSADGSFVIEVGARLSGGGPKAHLLNVSTPERSGRAAIVLHETEPVVIGPSTQERFLVEVDPQLLEAHGIPGSQTPFDAESIRQGVSARARALTTLDEAWSSAGKERVAAARSTTEAYENGFRAAFLQEISSIPEEVPEGDLMSIDGDPDRTVGVLNDAALEQGLARIDRPDNATDGGPRRTRYFLTQDQIRALDDLIEEHGETLTAAQLETVLRLGEANPDKPRPTRLSEGDGAQEKVFEPTFDERRAEDLLTGATELDDRNGENGDGDATGDIPDLVARTVEDIDAPFGQTGDRPDQGDVINSIRGFALSPGPADVPALFDFHQLNIAFPHVWKEYLDERLEPLARRAFTGIRSLGGDPELGGGAAESGRRRSPLTALRGEADLVLAAGIEPVPRMLYRQGLDGSVDRRLSVSGGIFAAPHLPTDPDRPVPPPLPPPLPPPPPPDDGGGLGIPLDEMMETAPQTDTRADPPSSVVDRLERILRGPYSFTAFGADTKTNGVNFGVAVTYRQRWEPVTYQVGELIRTVTLAPGETKKYTKRMRVTRKRAEKEITKNSSIRREEFDTTTRGESEIVRKAQAKTNFSITAEGTYNFGIAQGDSTTSTNHDAESASDDTKKSFREAVIKASQEYRQEHTLDVSSESVFETEEVETGEISNPNTELTVTYLFFELQRRFRISERIHAAQPVVLVAHDLPKPNQIDEAFVIRHGWILRRALLDDSYEATLDYVCGPLAGDRVARQALYQAMQDHKAVVDRLKDDLYAMKEQASEGYEALRRAVEARISAVNEETTDGFLADIAQSFVGGGQDPEAARMREEAARSHEQRAVEEVKRLTLALQREVSAYAEATEKYTRAHKAFAEWRLRLADLLVHLKVNICHYMQAVWAYEHPDQRFMRLRMKPAPGFRPRDGGATYTFLGEVDLSRETVASDGTVIKRRAVEFAFTPSIEVVGQDRSLAQIADLHTLLGFMGNYLIFPLRESNPLTDYLLEPYVDAGFRLLDPHDPGNLSRDEFARYVQHLRRTLDDEAFERLRPQLLERFRSLLLSAPTSGDEIVVPTGSAYIEALPGANPLLEDFMLAHRAIDVLHAREDVRQSALENLRRAARLLGDELGDPDVDARYVIEGAGAVHVGTPDLPGVPSDTDEE